MDNPVNTVNPDGMDWISAIFNNELFAYNDSRINCEEDISRYYYDGGKNINYVGKRGMVTRYDGENDNVFFNLGSDGNFYDADGKQVLSEFNIEGKLHVGSDVIDKNSEYSHNWYGTYLGLDNPYNK